MNNSNYEMNSNSKSTGKGGLSRPRFAKVRKQIPSHGSTNTAPFNPISKNPVIGIFNNKEYVNANNGVFVFGTANINDQTMYSKLPDDISKLNIADDVHNKTPQFSFRSAKNVVQPLFGSSLAMEVENQIKKLNIKDTAAGVGGDGLNSDAMRNTKNTLPDMFNNLNIKESTDGNSGLNDSHQTKQTFQAGLHDTGIPFQPVMNSVNASSVDAHGETVTSTKVLNEQDEMRTPYVVFKTPNLKEYTVSGLNRNFEARRDAAKEAKLKKKKGNFRKSTTGNMRRDEDFVFVEGSSSETCNSNEAYSPMDVSPYQETVAENNHSGETSVTTDEALLPDDIYASSESHPTVSTDAIDEDLSAATNRLDINKRDAKYTGFAYEACTDCCGKGFVAEGPSEESISGAETESFKSAAEQLDYSSDTFVTADDTEVSSGSALERQETDGRTHLNFASSSKDSGSSSFTFAASSSNQAQLSADTHHYKKKHRLKVGHDTYSSFLNDSVPHESSSMPFFPISGTSSSLSPRHGRKGDAPNLFARSKNKSELIKEQEVNQVTFSSNAASIAAQEACEKWRLRGNQAYANGDLSKAEDYYTKGMNCVSKSETSKSCVRALVLCYSNRAATRMCSGRMREALQDCLFAANLDPSFLKMQVRAANCYLALGEADIASVHFMKCMQEGNDACQDPKHLVEASEGLDKAKKVLECMKQSAELLQQRTPDYAKHALVKIEEALTISSFSEKLQEMKADVLFMLRRYEEVIKFCEETMDSAKINCSVLGADNRLNNVDDYEIRVISSFRLWRWNSIIKSYFYLGKMDEALAFVKKQEELGLIMERKGNKSLESVIPLVCTIRELLYFKVSGNEAFQSGRHAEAIEHYTAALSCNMESRPFAAVCFCNRAAAYQAMGQIAYAIADCNLAIALDGNYAKAISRRATLFEMIRDFGQAYADLQRLVSVLKKHVDEKVNQYGASDRMTRLNELKQTHQRLNMMDEEARKEIPLNMYLILGVEPSAASSEIKKAYRKAALKHHPDKASQFLTRSDNGDDCLLKEIAEEVHKDTERLFKMIGEAYAVLSDSVKRSRYDQEEMVRNSHKKGNRSSMSGTNADVHNYPSERSGSRRHWEEVWRSSGNSQPSAPERSRFNRYCDERFV